MDDGLLRRYWLKVDKRGPDECWPWRGSTNRVTGYGQIRSGGRGPLLYAHRLALEIDGRPCIGSQVPDHLCRNRGCVNPLHLEPVTRSVNCQRGWRKGWMDGRCLRGHDVTDPSNVVRNGPGKVTCRECRVERQRASTKASVRRAKDRLIPVLA